MAMPQREIRTINGIDKLRCSVCKYWLPFDEFSNTKHTSTGKRSYCKVCQKSKYDSKRVIPSNSGIIGLFIYNCPACKLDFTTKNPSKVFCSDKCRKRDWYLKNEKDK